MKTTLWLVAALTIAACGGDDGPPVALADVDRQALDAVCQQFVRCGLVSSVEVCEPAIAQIPTSVALAAAVDAGQVIFDGDAARACFAAIADAACEVTAVAYRARPEACLTIFRGTVAEGGACTLDQECVSQRCPAPACDQACCPGTCAGGDAPALAAAGASCETATCDAASYCDQVDHTCMPLKGANASCESFDECADGLYCLLSGTCGSLPAEGQTCDVDGCQRTNDRCDPDTHLCTAAGIDGAPCTTQSDCSAVLTCDNTRHCSGGTPLDGPCRTSSDCAPATRCDIAEGDSTGLCHALHGVGESCVSSFDCSSHKCDRDAQRCLADVACP